MIRLLNSAMMPAEGTYTLRRVTAQQFAELLQGDFVSYIGYPQTADFVSRLIGRPCPVNRAQTILDDGDTLAIVKLKYRPDAPTKGAQVNEDDFEFFVADYSAA